MRLGDILLLGSLLLFRRGCGLFRGGGMGGRRRRRAFVRLFLGGIRWWGWVVRREGAGEGRTFGFEV